MVQKETLERASYLAILLRDQDRALRYSLQLCDLNQTLYIDNLLREAWSHIYRGSTTDVLSHVVNYLLKYARYLFRASALKLSPLTAIDRN